LSPELTIDFTFHNPSPAGFHSSRPTDMTVDLPPSPHPLPPRTRLLLNLSTQSQLLDQFFTTLSTPTSTTATQLPNLYQLLQETTNDLLALRKDVAAHQEVWARIEGKKKEVVDLEKRSRGLMRALKVESEELGVMVKEGKEIMASVDKVEKSTFGFRVQEWRRRLTAQTQYMYPDY
jgi:hypothetical protein